MNENILFCRRLIPIGIIVFLIWFGCATESPQSLPQEKIRSRANQAFNELETTEGGEAARLPSKAASSDIENSASNEELRKKNAPVILGGRPDWVDGPSSEFPYTRYITGIGYGADRQAAEDKARAEVSKIFFSDIHSSNRTYQKILESRSGGMSTSHESINFAEIIKVSTHKILSGVRVVQVFRDPGSQPEFFALAVLDRSQSRVILRGKIHELDENIQLLISAVGRQQDTLSRVKLLQASIRKHALRQAYNTELKIVDPGAGGIPPPVNITDIKTRLNKALLKDFFIALSLEGPGADEVGQAIVEALNRKGYSVCEEIDKASILARGMIEIKSYPQSVTGWVFVRWKAYFDLVDREGGAVFGSVQKSGKAGHLTLYHAEDRAVGDMRQVLAFEISENLNRYIMTREN